jgi:hypothetical protein
VAASKAAVIEERLRPSQRELVAHCAPAAETVPICEFWATFSVLTVNVLCGELEQQRMDLPEAWRQIIVEWAERNTCVGEVWLCGSRVKGNPKKNDVDLALTLMPPTPSNNWPSSQKYPTDWAREEYGKSYKAWQRDLSDRIGCKVELFSLPDPDRGPLVRLWARETSS